jgi:prepilin-type N-terminal cleavage/methylation domain-containing protein
MRIRAIGRRGFTLVELLVVIGIIALLISMLFPTLARARMQSQIVRVHSDLRQITMSLTMYSMDNHSHLPPTRLSCATRISFELPMELAQYRYLPGVVADTVLKVNFDDPFNPGETYLYTAPGDAIVNEYTIMHSSGSIYVPDGYPTMSNQLGQNYNDPKTSPVRYAVWSVGPNTKSPKFSYSPDGQCRPPVPSHYWCMGAGDTGVIADIVSTRGADELSP